TGTDKRSARCRSLLPVSALLSSRTAETCALPSEETAAASALVENGWLTGAATSAEWLSAEILVVMPPPSMPLLGARPAVAGPAGGGAGRAAAAEGTLHARAHVGDHGAEGGIAGTQCDTVQVRVLELCSPGECLVGGDHVLGAGRLAGRAALELLRAGDREHG